MSRLIGIVGRDESAVRRSLLDASGSVRLGRHDGGGWSAAAAEGAVAQLLLGRLRNPTGDGVSQDRTHLLSRGPWAFLHVGALECGGELRSTFDDARQAALRSRSDSEVFFAFLLAKLGLHPSAASSRLVTDMVLARAIEDLFTLRSLGDATFLLSDGIALYAFCRGRPLFLLERRDDSHVQAILVASEPIPSEEPWTPIADGALAVVWRQPSVGWGVIRGGGAPELRPPLRR
jgi:predicted glutamine amidotransferase